MFRAYVERDVVDNDITRTIIKNANIKHIVEIERYQEIFNRKKQNYDIQKQNLSIIIAKDTSPLLYKGTKNINSYKKDNLFYISPIKGCIYNCKYCILKAMFESSYIVFFVNLQDYFEKIDQMLKIQSMYLGISYLTDILAFENIYPYTKSIIQRYKENPNLEIEIRTKSEYFLNFYAKNVFYAYSFNTKKISDLLEVNTPSLQSKIINIKRHLMLGNKIKIAIEPIISYEGYILDYKELIDFIFKKIKPSDIQEFAFGYFRMPKNYFEKYQNMSNINFNHEYDIEDLFEISNHAKQYTDKVFFYEE